MNLGSRGAHGSQAQFTYLLGSFKELEGAPPILTLPLAFPNLQSSSLLSSSRDTRGEVSLHSGTLAHTLLPSPTSCNPGPRAASSTANASQKHRRGNTAGRAPKFDCYHRPSPIL